tara:strand:- start:30142 stop:30351 length:210 start_codon:yes stop_codon:yes gene_type:complete
MKKLNTTQKVVFTLGLLGVVASTYGKFQGWEYNEYFPIFYSSLSMMWIAFLPQKKSCCNLFKRKAMQKP